MSRTPPPSALHSPPSGRYHAVPLLVPPGSKTLSERGRTDRTDRKFQSVPTSQSGGVVPKSGTRYQVVPKVGTRLSVAIPTKSLSRYHWYQFYIIYY
nr:MAG TPA: hypothetical protein [Caudoviricetes sp.]